VIRNALKSKVGHPYSPEDAEKDMLWVSRLGSFTSVAFETEPVEDGIVLIIKVMEATPYLPSLSFKLTDENGLEIGPSLNSFNLFGTATRASAYFMFGGATNVGLRYTNPRLPIKDWSSGFRIEYFHRERTNELLDFKEKTDEIFFEIGQPSSEVMRTGARFRFLGLRADRDTITLDTDNSDHIASLGIFVQHDSRNSVYPTNGFFLELEGSKYGIFRSDADYWRVDVDVRRYLPFPFLGWRHSLALYSYAALVSGEVGTTVPYHQEFYIGGTNSVRGWSLGSRHGKNQWLSTAEYWYNLMPQKKWKVWFFSWRMGFQLGVFGDLSTAWTEPRDLEGNMLSGFGAGFRLSMPVITLIRLDLAYGERDLGVKLYIGGGEKAEVQKTRVR
jgi:outer membrane protein assembly factor BamA